MISSTAYAWWHYLPARECHASMEKWQITAYKYTMLLAITLSCLCWRSKCSTRVSRRCSAICEECFTADMAPLFCNSSAELLGAVNDFTALLVYNVKHAVDIHAKVVTDVSFHRFTPFCRSTTRRQYTSCKGEDSASSSWIIKSSSFEFFLRNLSLTSRLYEGFVSLTNTFQLLTHFRQEPCMQCGGCGFSSHRQQVVFSSTFTCLYHLYISIKFTNNFPYAFLGFNNCWLHMVVTNRNRIARFPFTFITLL